ncbi:LysR substrate-binding domain-containing protein [Polynucleobacter necessarius]|uniref:LysR substrate-binding domain-containing protein n=1 Tax=Polynucleobacter necessarius TaxID=576610 RepID=UPI000E095B57|nr:LysR substrate-binding domain-containing protein [Polynucleobacter necessarius]HAT39485.1 hypothetical protein [Polynucleobacter sp.]
MLLIASKEHLLAKKKIVDLSSLKNEKFIFREKGSGTRMATDAHFKRLKLKPEIRLELGRSDQEEVAILKCKEFPIESSWHIVSPKGKQLSPIATILKERLCQQAKSWK